MARVLIGDEDGLMQLPPALRQLMTFERHHLYRREFFQNYPGIDERYFPQNAGVFELPCYWIPRNKMYVYEAQSGALEGLRLSRGSGFGGQVLFPIHPLSVSRYAPFLTAMDALDARCEGLRMLAIPTSSPRTLLVWPDNDPARVCFAKTTMFLDSKIGDWRLHLKKVGYCVGMTKILGDSQSVLSSRIDYFPEAAGLVPRTMLDGGVIIRSIPERVSHGKLLVAPLFSLMGGEGVYKPLLLRMAQACPRTMVEFVQEVLCEQFARVWVEMSLRHGILLEAHGQNLMIRMTAEMEPTGVFTYKDLDGITVDWDLRRALGISERNDLPCAWAWSQAYATMFPGLPHWDSAWLKMRVSLYAYLHFFLNEMNVAIQRWQKGGLMGGRKLKDDELTMWFSRTVIGAACGLGDAGIVMREYNAYRALPKFLKFLLEVRRAILLRANDDLGAGSARTLSSAQQWKSSTLFT